MPPRSPISTKAWRRTRSICEAGCLQSGYPRLPGTDRRCASEVGNGHGTNAAQVAVASPSRKRRARPNAVSCLSHHPVRRPAALAGRGPVRRRETAVRHDTGRGDPATCRRCPHLPHAAWRRARIVPNANRRLVARYLGLHVTVTPENRAKKSRIEAIRLSLMEVPVRAKPPEGNTRRAPMGGEMRPGDDAHMGNRCSGNKHVFASHPCKKSQAVKTC